MSKNPLVGKYFHSLKDGQVHWQGTVLGTPEPGWYLVQLFEWIMGEPSNQGLVRFTDMAEWLFYENADQMKFSYEHGMAREGGPYQKRLST
jgi:hypothetical protein